MNKIETKEELLKKFLNKEKEEIKCEGDECLMQEKGDIIEKMNKKIITQDGRQLLREIIHESN
jgi:hypothetical protein